MKSLKVESTYVVSLSRLSNYSSISSQLGEEWIMGESTNPTNEKMIPR